MNMYTSSNPNEGGVMIKLTLLEENRSVSHLAAESGGGTSIQFQKIPLVFSCGTGNYSSFNNSARKNTRRPTNRDSAKFLFSSIAAGNTDDVKQCMTYVNFEKILDEEDRNPLMAALFITSRPRRHQIVELFAINDMSTSQLDKTWKRDALGWACVLGLTWEVKLIMDIMQEDDSGINYHTEDISGNSYLHLAVISGDVETVGLIFNPMININISLDTPNNEGLTAYILSRRLGLRNIANLLITDGGASVQKSDDCMFLTAREWSIVGSKERHQNFVKSIKQWPFSSRPNGNSQLTSAASSLPRNEPVKSTPPAKPLALVHSFLNTWSDQRNAGVIPVRMDSELSTATMGSSLKPPSKQMSRKVSKLLKHD